MPDRLFSTPRLLVAVLALTGLLKADVAPTDSLRHIPVAEYRERVAASWLGQIVGNIYGLSYEFRFLEEPGPDRFPYGYGATLERVRELNGAFSDDDTDIEYISLLQMERHGPEPGYGDLARAWTYHIRDRIWAANRVALTLMHHGFWPPATGDSTNNPRWFEIDPQLVNEIWAVTAPGMVPYAVAKTRWAARITNDGFGVEPAMFYAAMYAEAFFSRDVAHLIDTGVAALPPGSRFARVVAEMRALHAAHPDDWQAARRVLRDRYYRIQPYNRYGWAPIDATLNGGAAVLALLYGGGDLRHTLDLSCAMGFDADNQAATLTGLLALASGMAALPRDLLHPLAEVEWRAPFNDRYVNVPRHDMPDARISDMARRLAAQGEAVIRATGGTIETRAGVDTWVIRRNAAFIPPFELLPPAPTLAEVGMPLSAAMYAADGGRPAELTVRGSLPPGIEFSEGRFSGIPRAAGDFEPIVTLSDGTHFAESTVRFIIRTPNLSGSAARILHNGPSAELERLRDGRRKHPAFYSDTRPSPFRQHYGYEWTAPLAISRLGLHVGFPREEWGWLRDVTVEFRDPEGRWRPVTDLRITPPLPAGDSKYLQPGMVGYDLRFAPERTDAIRIVGTAGGHPVDQPPTYGSSVAELTVHAE